MDKKLGMRLREVKNDLEEIVKKLESNDSNKEYLLDIIHVKSFLGEWVTSSMENKSIRDVATDVYLKLAQIVEVYNFKKNDRRCQKKIFMKSIKKLLQVIDEELPKVERIDSLEDKLLKAEITLPNYDYYSEEKIQEMIHSNARAIAQLLVTSNK